MSAETTGHVMWSPNPVRQRLANYFIEDVLDLPDDAPRVELRDGVPSVVPSPTYDHQDIAGLLWHWLRRHAPDGLRSSLATGVALSLRYELTADSETELVLSAPFAIKLPIQDSTP